MKKTCIFIMATAFFLNIEGQVVTEEVYNPNPKPPTDGLVGANYTPAYAVNQVQFWHDFRPEIVDKELAAAQRYFGITTLRVYLHNINFEEEKDIFLANVEKFLKICEKNRIRPGFTFFDDCHRHNDIFLDAPTTPVKGWHNGRWAACPQDRDRDPEDLQKFKSYIQEVIQTHRTDKRVLWWEIFNEPMLSAGNHRILIPGSQVYSDRLRRAGYQWAKEVKPIQPVINCWNDSEVTDIVNAHNYTWDQLSKPSGLLTWDSQANLNVKKGTVFTEAGARWYAPRPSNGEPCEVLDWLERRRTSGKSTPGVYLCWELMVGNSNCRWYWGTPPDSPEPTIPWCGLMWPDATPVSLAESEASLRYTTGKGRALFFENFQNIQIPQLTEWKVFGENVSVGSGVLTVSSGIKMVVGDTKWKDYILESVVMLKDTTGNAGLLIRVNDPGLGKDEFKGYYIGFNTKTLFLQKITNNNRQILRNYDLKRLDCKVVEGVWNHMRVEANGNRLKIWFNRLHPSSDKENGLRIDFSDLDAPVLSGNIGVQAQGTVAWFDNMVVMPIK